MVNTRKIALDIIEKILERDVFLNPALSDLTGEGKMTAEESAFVRRLVYGVVERRIELDHIIDCFSKVKTARMKPTMRCILRMGVYQIIYMDSVPDHAAINESVKLAKKRGFSGLSGFVNGVLHTVCRERGSIPYPEKKDGFIEALSVRYSMPGWMIALWERELGAEKCEEICASFLERRKICVRVNRARADAADIGERLKKYGLKTEAVSFCGEIIGYELEGRIRLDDIPEMRDGLIYIQDKNAMRIVPMLGLKPGEHVLDVCAAPGGKALQAAEYVSGGSVKACDVSAEKTALIDSNIKRMRLDNISSEVRDAKVPDKSECGKYDAVICDLPCSGLGVIAGKPDIKYKTKPGDIEELATIQREILDVASAYVKRGGRLIYSTCTVTDAENRENAKWFAKEHPEFELLEQRSFLPGDGDGFFAALFRLK